MPLAKYVALVATFLVQWAIAAGQTEAPRHLNKTIEKLEAGEVVFGSFASDKSPGGGAFYGAAPLDFVVYDMEHEPLDFVGFRTFLQFMLDRRQIVEKGNLQPEVTPLIRLPFYGRERNHWLIKQALDTGAFGILFPHVSSVEEARSIVSGARYPHSPDAPDAEPGGMRGYAPGIASRYWGLSMAEYARRADTWPLDPNGDILLILLIENQEGIENIEAIAREVKGIGVLVPSPVDLAMSYGAIADPSRQPVVESAIQKVVEVCRSTGIPCGTLANKENVEERIRRGYRFLIVPTEREFEAVRIGRGAAR
jgi:4-hydroxy-2-oxoheptanedioate aldolase